MQLSRTKVINTDKTHFDVCILHLPPDRIDFPPLKAGLLAARLNHSGLTTTVLDVNVYLRREVRQKHQSFWQPVNEHYWHDRSRLESFCSDNVKLVEIIVEKIAAIGAKFIVVDLIYPKEKFFVELLKKLKNVQPDLKVIAAGSSCLLEGQQRAIQDCCQNKVSFFFSSKSFLNIPVFLAHLSRKKKIALTVKQQAALEKYLAQNQDELSNILPDYQALELREYRGKCFAVSTGTGCNCGCNFCSKHIFENEHHVRSSDSIIREILSLQEQYGAHNFYFCGAPINWKIDVIEAVCDYLINENQHISWSAEVSASPEIPSCLLKKMKRAGCHTIHICAVSGSDTILSNVEAGFSVDQTEKFLKTIHSSNIRCAIQLITGNLREYRQEQLESIDFISRNPQPVIGAVLPFAILKVYAGTELWKKLKDQGALASSPLAVDKWACSDGNNFYIRKIQQNQLHYHILKFNIPYNPDNLYFANVQMQFNPAEIIREKKYLLNSYYNPWHTYRSDIISKSVINYVWGKTAVVEKNEIDYPVIHGVKTETDAFIGPETVHFDITNICNYDCIACWDRSPLIRDKEDLEHEDYLKKFLSYKQITNLIDDLVELGGLRFIKFSGGGEPTMHPRFGDILTYLRKKDRYVEIDINTNFSLMSEKLLQKIITQRVDLLTVSLWAASPETYAKTHPNQKETTFGKIVANLKRVKGDPRNRVLRLFLHNVLMRDNYHEVEAMVKLGLDVEADEVHFTMVDVVPGKTGTLLLSTNELQLLVESLGRIKPHVDRHNLYHDPETGRSIHLTNFHEFFSKLSQQEVEEGVYDLKAVNQVPCYIGWLYTRVMADGRVVPCCKGHLLPMGNLNDKRFYDIWNSTRYKIFRKKGLLTEKSNPYFSVMGSDGAGRTGCLNCDNIIHNIVMHDKYLCYSDLGSWFGFKMKQWWEKLF